MIRKNSLLSKYIFLIIFAIGIFPLTTILVSILIYNPIMQNDKEFPNKYQDGTQLEEWWHNEAEKLAYASPEEIDQRLGSLHQKYNKANMFWVDKNGFTQEKIPDDLFIPDSWSASYTVDFMKENRGSNTELFTIVAFIGESNEQGFMVFQVPREDMEPTGQLIREKYDYIFIVATLVILVAFVIASAIFFIRIRRRLLNLQNSMHRPSENGLPSPIKVKNKDEIGQLEESFNQMIEQLEESRKREQDEELLRKELIANLSHDLRTPLTTIRAHAYSLQKDSLSKSGKESLQLIESKVTYLDKLIDNLLSYTLLSAGKYTYHPEKIDITRKVRTAIAVWYPVWEEAQFQIEVDLPEKQIFWTIDPQWFERILDNLFQNVLRHAKSGKYIAIKIEEQTHQSIICIKDKGPGMSGKSNEKGIGIGLAIVGLMLKEMNLDWDIDSNEQGTSIRIFPNN